MITFESLLQDPSRLAIGLKAVYPLFSERQRDDLGELYSNTGGFLCSRDAGKRIRANTVYSCSKIGSYLTEHFDGVGAIHSMMWIGFVHEELSGDETWVMRPEIRRAISALGWF